MKMFQHAVDSTTVFLFGLLLAAGCAEAQIIRRYLPELEVKVDLANGKTVMVKGPGAELDDFGEPYYSWHLVSRQRSQNGKFTAIHYAGNHWQYWDAIVYLVNPSGKIIELKKSMVNQVVWSQDGKYLLGFGNNTFRVWNQLGNVQQVTFDSILGFEKRGQTICLAVRKFGDGQSFTELAKIFSIPQLKLLSTQPLSEDNKCQSQSVSFPAQ